MLDFDKRKCTGCTLCASVCPREAINMEQSEDGFYVSVIDNEKCIQCNKCEKICPVINKKSFSYDVENYTFAFSNNICNRNNSTSGGVFFEIVKDIITDNGFVCGCVWDSELHAMHILTDNMQCVEQMKSSKYVQSNLNGCFKQIKELLTQDKKVLFVGTPCQSTALYRFIGDNSNLFICALVCGGVPSPKVWSQYLNYLNKIDKAPIRRVNHRSKKNGWLCLTIECERENGKKLLSPMVLDPYARAFFTGLSIGKFCEACSFKWNSFYADILIADGWGAKNDIIRKSKNRGLSSVVCLTTKGKDVWDKVKNNLTVETCTKEEFYSHHKVIFERKQRNNNRDAFFADLNDRDIIENINSKIPKRKHTFLNSILNKLGIYGFVYTRLKSRT